MKEASTTTGGEEGCSSPTTRYLTLLIVLVEDPSMSLFAKLQQYGVLLKFHNDLSKSIAGKEESILSTLVAATQHQQYQSCFDKITVRKCFIRNEDNLADLIASKFSSSSSHPSSSNIVVPAISVYTAKMLSKHKVPNCIVHDSGDWQMYDRLDSKVNILDLKFSDAIPHIPTLSSLQVRKDPSSLKSFLEVTASTSTASNASLQQQQVFILKDEFGEAGMGNRKVNRDDIVHEKFWEGSASFVVQPYYAEHNTWAADILTINGSVRGGIIRVVEPLTYKAQVTGCMSTIYLPANDNKHHENNPIAHNIWTHITNFCEQQNLSGNYHFEFLEPLDIGDESDAESKKEQPFVMLMEINPRVSGVALYYDASGHLPWIEYSLLKYLCHLLQVKGDENVDHDGDGQVDHQMEDMQKWDLFDGNKLRKPAHLPKLRLLPNK